MDAGVIASVDVHKFSLEGRLAVGWIKQFIQENVATDVLDERAFALAGSPQGQIDEAIGAFCCELSEIFAQERVPEKLRVGFIIAAGEIVHDRIAELGSRGVGHT